MKNVRNNRYPFTATQWQALEHQALIFKHVVSGDPVPTHLLSTLKTSFNSSSTMFPQQPIGWGSFEMGLGRKVDTEPWRCRRTDGKKWRCSKEAHQDSKYCERHMHRGRNRSGSRKPVELSITPSSPKYPSSSQSSTAYQFFLGSGSSYSHTDKKDYRYLQRMGDGGERDFFPKALKTERSLHESYAPFTTTGNSKEQEKQHQEIHNKPFHHFLSEWTPKSRVSNWLDNKEDEDNQLKHSSSVSNTQLSISMPSSTRELFQQKARLD